MSSQSNAPEPVQTRQMPWSAAGSRAIRAASRAAYADLAPLVGRLRREGIAYATIADWLNRSGRRTRLGRTFCPNTVRRIHLRSTIPVDARNQSAPL